MDSNTSFSTEKQQQKKNLINENWKGDTQRIKGLTELR